MKIAQDKNIIELTPENTEETQALENLWRQLVDCNDAAKKLVPIGEYLPMKKNMARFVIE